ncbi:hypothetical protein MalM25_18580 [Planctomycetes bacterium MalM25]|nr:hypothetical protein MalM25_18580 [Planctomycetes bacterium MalM25]
MFILRLLCVATLLVASLGALEASASELDAPLVTKEALDGLPLTAPLELSDEVSLETDQAEEAPMIPEPAGIALIGGGLLAMVVLRRRFG